MLISIIIPVYNDQKGLNQALNNIKSQILSFGRFEVIVIDNNSNPPMKPCFDSQVPHKIYTCRKPGSYAARNLGVKKSRGDILVFLDADCSPSSQWLETGVNALLENTNSIVGGDVLFVKSLKPTAIEQYQYITGFGQAENITKKNFTATANLFTTSEIFSLVGPFKETLLSGGDREWCWRAKKMGFTVRFCPDAIVYTKARHSLRKAVIQVRRVTGGRYQIKKLNVLTQENKGHITPHRNPLQAISFIFAQTQFSLFIRLKILSVATILKLIQAVEKVRLSCGLNAERR